jgi:hypothetical protein
MTPYILHVSLLLSACLLFYKLLLQKETFFRLNRVVLLSCFVLSFTLPLLPVPGKWSLRQSPESSVVLPAESLLQTGVVPDNATHQPPALSAQSIKQTEGPSLLQWVLSLYWFGLAAFGLNFLIQLVLLLHQAYSRPVIRDGRFRIVEVSGDKAPCSFANNIFINPEKYDWHTYNQILLHEKIHIQQGHSWDLLLAELVIIFQWFNPFAWLYRKELENNLEFLTDSELLQQHAVEPADYQMSLLRVSAPQLPLSLTTNYNQSLLKKRFVMMNAKKSNLHTTWKYFFLFPVLALMVSLLNEPISAQTTRAAEKRESTDNNIHSGSINTEGAWFATIKDDKITIQFKGDEDEQSTNSNTFPLSAFPDLPRDRSGSFSLSRDAGTMQFTGKFEGDQGMGRYKFSANHSFREFLTNAGVRETDEEDMMVFFMVDVNRGYVQMLQANGYKNFDKNDLVPLAALKVDGNYIQSLSKTLGAIELQTLIPLKALGVDQAYVQDIRNVYPKADAQRLIALKAQGIDSKFITDVRSSIGTGLDSKENAGKRNDDDDDDDDNIVAIKALNIDAAYINSLKQAGYDNLSSNDVVAMKAQGITAEWIRELKGMGFKDIPASHLIGIKAQNITPEYIRGLEAVGFKDIEPSDLIAVKALGITPEYVRDFKNNGYPDITLREAVPLKAQGITVSTIREYKALGFENLSLNDVVAARATGTTPAFISSMREKGHNMKRIDKYIQLKNAVE